MDYRNRQRHRARVAGEDGVQRHADNTYVIAPATRFRRPGSARKEMGDHQMGAISQTAAVAEQERPAQHFSDWIPIGGPAPCRAVLASQVDATLLTAEVVPHP
jgi:hypothetical protein